MYIARFLFDEKIMIKQREARMKTARINLHDMLNFTQRNVRIKVVYSVVDVMQIDKLYGYKFNRRTKRMRLLRRFPN